MKKLIWQIRNREIKKLIERFVKLYKIKKIISKNVIELSYYVIYKSTCPENYIPMVMPPLNPTSPPSMVATFLATRLMAVLQLSGYSVFHDGDTPIRLGLP